MLDNADLNTLQFIKMPSTALTRRTYVTTFTSEDLKNAMGKTNSQATFEALKQSQLVSEAPYHPGYEDAIVNPDEGRPLSEVIRQRIQTDGGRFWAGDNISEYIKEEEKARLVDELTEKFEGVLDSLIIDRHQDPNSQGTARRLAKMYVYEIMSGRYEPAPDATAFPNEIEEGYKGMLVVRSELRSMCSHHHQPVKGVAYIGIIAADKLIGLSKYTRIAQWCAQRGTLQEELCNDIAREIMKATGSKNVAVYIQATHGCCENRGIMAHSSLTQTTVLEGSFQTDPDTKKEFFDNIKLQQEFAPR